MISFFQNQAEEIVIFAHAQKYREELRAETKKNFFCRGGLLVAP